MMTKAKESLKSYLHIHALDHAMAENISIMHIIYAKAELEYMQTDVQTA